DEPDGSGLATCVGSVDAGDPIDTSMPGAHSFTVAAGDAAGNRASVTTTYMVFATWQGPAALGPAVNRMNAGRAIPVSFGLGWDRGSDLLAAGSPASQRVDCGSLAAMGPMESASGPGLVGGSSTGKYTY